MNLNTLNPLNMMRAFIIAIVLLCCAQASAQATLPPWPGPLGIGSGMGGGGSGPAPNTVTGLCGTVNAVAYFSAGSVISCDSLFKYTPGSHVLSLDVGASEVIGGTSSPSSAQLDIITTTSALSHMSTSSATGEVRFTMESATDAFHIEKFGNSFVGAGPALLGGYGAIRNNGTMTFLAYGSAGFFTLAHILFFTEQSTNPTLAKQILNLDEVQHPEWGTSSIPATINGASTCTPVSGSGLRDMVGIVTATCSVGQTVVVSFATVWNSAPVCTFTARNTAALTDAFTAPTTTSDVTFTATVGSVGSAIFGYQCSQSG